MKSAERIGRIIWYKQVKLSEIRPYNEFCLGCGNNLMLSVLQSIDAKYKNVVINNNYDYIVSHEISDCKKEFNLIKMKYTNFNMEGDLFTNGKYFTFNSDEEMLTTIKNLLNENKFVFPFVDLFYWVDGNFSYEKNHWYHYTLLQNYDEENDCFSVIDYEYKNGVDIYKVSCEKFLKAVKTSGIQQVEINAYDVNPNIRIKDITKKTLLYNAHRLVKSIAVMEEFTYWDMLDDDFRLNSYRDFNYVDLYLLVQRQSITLKLFKEIKKINICDTGILDNIEKLVLENFKKWTLIRLSVYKLYLQNEFQKSIKKINSKVRDAFSKEKLMWELFIEAMEKIDINYILFKF